jgi:hypothetical protein
MLAEKFHVDVAVPKAGALRYCLYNLLGQKVLSGKIARVGLSS